MRLRLSLKDSWFGMSMGNPSSQEAIHALYSEHHGWLRDWLRRRMGNATDAADLAQDIFVRILGAPQVGSRIAAIREPRSYLAAIAHRVMVDHFRRLALERAYLQLLAQQREIEIPGPEERAIMLDALIALDTMLAGLGVKVRRAFLLSQLQGLPYAEIASRLSVSVSSVKKYVAKATEHCLLYALKHEL